MPDLHDVHADIPAASRSAAIRRGSRSFALAARLFDPQTRALVWDLYTWCRHCDDVIDGQAYGHASSPAADAATALDELRRSSEAALRGVAAPGTPFGALARVADATHLPPIIVFDHLDGFAMDVAHTRCATFDDTLEYAYHVAGAVGLMMAWVMGARNREALYRASDLGIAFQLSNIARDVGDDARVGRVYLPADWLDEAGAAIEPGAAIDEASASAVAPVVARLVREAERYYDSAWYGLRYLPLRSAWAVTTARVVYRRIGRKTVARGRHAWTSRTVVNRAFKGSSVLLGGLQSLWLVRGPRFASPPRTGLYTPATIELLR
ncbi:MAG: phytoene/squalene synthase family protein [Acidobacteria bacterium]|nr:phytoene/squalene synthase family protein [Acidobacteriota bacterium]